MSNAARRRKDGYYTTGPDLRAGSISSQYGQFQPPSGPPPSPFVDNLSASFAPPAFSTTVHVSGGGAALQTAVNAAAAQTKIIIDDSLNYDGQLSIVGKTDLTIEAAAGQTPSITAVAGVSQSCVRLGAGNIRVKLKGIHFIGNGNLNPLSMPDSGLVLGTASVTGLTDLEEFTVEDCVFTELDPANGVPGILLIGGDGTLWDNVLVIGCTFTDMATPAFTSANGTGAVCIGGFDKVWVQNTKIARSAVARASSNMRGVVLKNITSVVQDVLCFDLGTAGSNESFKHNNEAVFGSVVGGTSTWSNCVAYNAKRGFRLTQAAATMLVDHGTFYNDTAGIAAAQVIMLQSAGVLTVTNSVIESVGDGTAFSATGVENNNDVFNVAAPGKVLDATDLTLDPALQDTPNNDYRATDPMVIVGGVGATPMGVYYPGGTTIFWAGVP